MPTRALSRIGQFIRARIGLPAALGLVLALAAVPVPADTDRLALVAAALDDSGEPRFVDNRARVRDLVSAMHGLSLTAAMARSSELAHPAYRPELDGEPRRAQATAWLDLLEAFTVAAGQGLGPPPHWSLAADKAPKLTGESRLADLAHGVYLYYMHHRGGRFEALPQAFF